MDIGQYTTTGNCDITEETVQLFVVLDGQGNVTGDDTTLLVVASGVAGQFENFRTEILEDGRQVHGCTGAHARRVLALANVASNTTDGELQARLGARADGTLLVTTTTLAFSCGWCGGYGLVVVVC